MGKRKTSRPKMSLASPWELKHSSRTEGSSCETERNSPGRRPRHRPLESLGCGCRPSGRVGRASTKRVFIWARTASGSE